MDNILIRSAAAQDVFAISELANRIWRKHYPSIITNEQIDFMLEKMYSAQSLRDQINKAYHFLIAQEKEDIIGYLSLLKRNGGNYFLDKLYVDTERQKRGVGKLLLNYATKEITDKFQIRLQVNRKNHKAINFYFKEGFVIESVEDFDIGNGFQMNDFVMQKCYDNRC